MKFTPSGLQTKVVLLLIVVTIIPLAVSGYYGTRIIRESRRQIIAELEWRLVTQWSTQIKKFIDDRLETFELIIADPKITSIDKNQQRGILASMLQQDEFLVEIAYTDPKGAETTHLIAGGKDGEKVNRKDDPAFLTAKERKKYLGPAEFDAEGIPIIVLGSPVTNTSGTFMGTLWGKLKLTKVRTELVSVRLGNAGYLFVLTGKGELVAFSGNFPFDAKGFTPSSLARSVMSGEERNGLRLDDRTTNANGQIVFGAGKTIPEVGWAVVTEWPEDEAMAPVRALTRSLVTVSTWTMAGLLVLSFLIAYALVRPIRTLQRGAAQIGKGDFKHRIFLKTHDEVAQLAQSFNVMAKDLEKLDELKAAKIRNEMLAKTLAREREISKLKDTIISVSSHQLRTPITSLKWNLELIADEKLSDQGKELLQGTMTNADDLNAIVEDLLLVSEFGFEYAVRKRTPVDLVKVVKAEVEKVRAEAQQKNLVLDLALPDSVVVQADERALGIVCQNLLRNAVTYTKTGSAKVLLEVSEKEARLTVQDTGIGIPDSEQKQIGQQFFRATNAIEAKNVGTGLGLFLAKAIIEGHHGSFSFVSELKKGSRFTVTLPTG